MYGDQTEKCLQNCGYMYVVSPRNRPSMYYAPL